MFYFLTGSQQIDGNDAAMVAFSASRGGDVVRENALSIPKDAHMRFPEVLINLGGAYDAVR